LEYNDEIIKQYSETIIADIAKTCNIPDLKSRIEFQQTFSIPEFESYYNAYKGTALGLAHTFFQSSLRRPDNYSKKVKDLYYA
jgi:phytoene dehydrogenase-like protein